MLLNKTVLSVLSAGWLTIVTATATGQSVLVTISGEVEFNQVASGFLGDVNVGDEAVISFRLDPNEFVDSSNFPTRGYLIDLDSFSISFAGNSIGLQDPFPGEPLFVIRDNDPAVDGFFLSTNTDFPGPVGIDQTGAFGQFGASFSVSYENDPLSSLNLLDAIGEYDFDGLSVFNMTIDDGPFQAVGMIFSNLTIASVPEPSAGFAFLVSLFFVPRRRRT